MSKWINVARELRYVHGVSVTQIAEMCGVSPRTVNGWAQGREPSGPALKIMEEKLNELERINSKRA